jgi:mono/diheme cytochrome c family protein
MGYLKSGMIAFSVCALLGAAAYAEEKDPTVSRVPADQKGAAKAMKNPVAKTPENIAKGKAIYEGKGTCFNCHGTSGKGDGPAGQILNPSPRNFTNPKFHKNRTDGEMFWIIKNGSAGTGMVPLIGTAITEDDAWHVILYERSFEGK